MSTDVASASDESTGHESEPAPHRTLKRVLISLGLLGLVLALVIGGGLWFLTNRYAGNIDRVAGVFSGLEERPRPAPSPRERPASAEPVTFLLVGSDTLEHVAPGELP